MMYNYQNWYWGPFGGQYYSSATQSMVASNDATLLAWQNGGNRPTPWPADVNGNQTRQSMQGVLGPLGMFVDLIAYANAQQWMRATGGYTTSIGGTHTFKTDAESLSLITSKQLRLQNVNPPPTVHWQFDDTTWVSFASADFTSIAIQLSDFVQATFDTLQIIVSGCLASPPTITSRAQIDNWAWPANHS